jgi:predicted TIM-barrel enzyme
VPEFASALGTRSIAHRAKSAVVSSLADAILISGPMAGEEPPLQVFEEVKAIIPTIPVLVNTGAREDNVAQFLRVADGVIVGSSLKEGGHTSRPGQAVYGACVRGQERVTTGGLDHRAETPCGRSP